LVKILEGKNMEHTFYECECDDTTSCQFCEGGLSLCTVCRGAEGTLTTECCGRPITIDEEDRIYKKRTLDFIGGKWVKIVVPTSVAEAVEVIYKPLNKKFKKEFISGEKEKTLAQFHSTMGRHIRNKFRLWYSNKPLEEDSGHTHADEISWVIMGALYDKIKEEK